MDSTIFASAIMATVMLAAFIGGFLLLMNVVLNEYQNTLKRVVAAVGVLILTYVFWYSLFALILSLQKLNS